MTFLFKYNAVPRKPNPMVTINPLLRGTGKTVTFRDRIDTLSKSANWKKTIKAWEDAGLLFDLSRMPKVAMVKLKYLNIDEDIQRKLDDKHCATKIANPKVFDPALLQTLQCIKTSTGKYVSIDGQHTGSSIAGLIEAGLVPGHTNWEEFEFPVQYIETDDLSFARKAFGILNGRGKKKQSAYQQLRNSVFVIRIDNNFSDEEDREIESKVRIAESFQCFPVDEDSSLVKYPGTFTNIATFKTMTENEIKIACQWHNKFFHYENVHVSLFFAFKDLCREFNAAKHPLSAKLQTELAALVQNLFSNLSQFQESVTEAHRRWTEKRYGYKAPWNDDAYACALVQLYLHFGGTEYVAPTLKDKFDGLIEFFDDDIMSLAA